MRNENAMERCLHADVSQDGSMIITRVCDRDAKILDVKTADCLQTLMVHTGGLNCTQFSPECTMALTSFYDRPGNFWDLYWAKALSLLANVQQLLGGGLADGSTS